MIVHLVGGSGHAHSPRLADKSAFCVCTVTRQTLEVQGGGEGRGGSNSKASRVNPTATAAATTTTATAAEIFVQLCLAGMLQTPTYPIHSTATPPAPTACHCLLPSPFALQNRVIGIFKQNSRFNTFWRMCVRVCECVYDWECVQCV